MNDKKRRSPGRPLRTFRTHGIRKRDLVWILPGLGLPLAALLYGSLQVYYGYTQNNAAVVWALAAAVLLVPFAVLSIRSFRRAGRGITVHAHGLRFVRLPAAPRFVFWEQIESVRTTGTRYLFFGAPLSDEQVLLLKVPGGRQVRVDESFEDLAALSEIIRTHTHSHIAARLAQTAAAGETVHFGPIAAEPAGLRINNRSLAWNSLETMQIDAGLLVIRSREHRMKIPVADIPNLDHLLALAAERTEANKS